MPGPWSHVGGHKHRIHERDDNPYRLGRHVNHDPRSLAYQVRPAGVLRSVAWERHIPILDQGQLGSCTGNAATGALGTGPLWDALQTVQRTKLNEAEAIALYSAATALDPYAGTYPPTDSGSDGVSVAKAAQKAGLIIGYVHATSIPAMNTALQTGPVIVGTNWYDSMFTPDASGFLSISGSPAGGHEYVIREYDVSLDVYTMDNSWGPDWGIAGRAKIRGKDMTRLLAEQGDCTQFLPLSVAPPVPSGDPDDIALWTATKDWAAARHVLTNAAAAKAVTAWAVKKGLT